jgi:hypothetical protein
VLEVNDCFQIGNRHSARIGRAPVCGVSTSNPLFLLMLEARRHKMSLRQLVTPTGLPIVIHL